MTSEDYIKNLAFTIFLIMVAFVLLIVPVYSILYIAFKEKIYTYNLDFKEKINKYFAKLTSQIQNAKIIKANIAMLFQTDILSDTSDYDNVTEFGRFTDCEEINRLARMINFNSDLLKEDMERVSEFSGGEKQKLGIIKTLLKDKKIIIMDEPTSSLDYESKMKFIKYLDEIKSNKIIILISHDQDVIKITDEILEL